MADRLAIHAELRRAVLVEAGHRCAIPTCRYPKVDLHHIVPWEQCGTHDYDNLIALCPNCHDRADRGEIDRKSLRMYKARLASSLGISMAGSDSVSTGNNVNTPAVQWQIKKIEEIVKNVPGYEFELEVPTFEASDLHEVNSVLLGWAYGHLHRFREADSFTFTDDMSPPPSTFSGSFEVSLYTDELLSLKYSVIEYGSGAAHSLPSTYVFNFQRRPIVPLSLPSLFRDGSEYLRVLSQYAVSFLIATEEEQGVIEWVRQGAGPQVENFEKFNLLPHGILITFGVYQVNCFAAGPQHVIIPYQYLRDLLNPRCSVYKLCTF